MWSWSKNYFSVAGRGQCWAIKFPTFRQENGLHRIGILFVCFWSDLSFWAREGWSNAKSLLINNTHNSNSSSQHSGSEVGRYCSKYSNSLPHLFHYIWFLDFLINASVSFILRGENKYREVDKCCRLSPSQWIRRDLEDHRHNGAESQINAGITHNARICYWKGRTIAIASCRWKPNLKVFTFYREMEKVVF